MKGFIKSLIFAFMTVIVLLVVSICFSWVNVYDTDTPDGDLDAPSTLDDIDRQTKAALQERLNIDHYFALDVDNQVSDADAGKHRRIMFQAPVATESMPTIVANQGWLGLKDYDGGSGAKAELTWKCEDDIELQLTELNTAGTGAALNITGTYENECAFTSTANSFYGDVIACTNGGYFTTPLDSTNTTEANLRYETTGNNLELRNASAWVDVLDATMAVSKLKVGTYTGNAGATQAITGVGFQPSIVFVIPHSSDYQAFIKTSGMGTTYAKGTGATPIYGDDSIRSIDADGFTVGDGTGGGVDSDNLNAAITYSYIALKVIS